MPLPALRSGTVGNPLSGRPLLVYVNVPFCNSKCHFCDWVTRVPVADLRLESRSPQRRAYVGALTRQIAGHAPHLLDAGYIPRIMYWGGGTASILSNDEIRAVHGALARHYPMDDVVEATIESSPDSLDPAKLSLLRSLGFNRISIGVQAFAEERLRMIGRSHSLEQARSSVREAAAAGFDNINIDLIVGFSDQEADEVRSTIEQALELPVNHFSVYPYRASHGTVLRRRISRGQAELDMRRQLDCYLTAREMLEAAGHREYAMSYFGSPQCLADDAYYRLTCDWIGFGSGANSLLNGRYLTNEQGELLRFTSRPLEFDHDVPAHSGGVATNFLAQALTTYLGADARLFEERLGLSLRRLCEIPEVYAYLQRMSRFGELVVDRQGVRIAPDTLAATFVGLSWIDLPVPIGSDADGSDAAGSDADGSDAGGAVAHGTEPAGVAR
jgi:coproporphyrinogen III oxidase-like Fe-S oxidoreductase